MAELDMSILSSIQSIKDNKKLQSAELCSWSYHVILWSLLSNDVLIINLLPSIESICLIQLPSLSHLYPTLIAYFIYRLPVPTSSIYNFQYYRSQTIFNTNRMNTRSRIRIIPSHTETLGSILWSWDSHDGISFRTVWIYINQVTCFC